MRFIIYADVRWAATRLLIAMGIVAFWIGVGTLLAGPERAKHRGWPNRGISEPGKPNHYASPRPAQHP